MGQMRVLILIAFSSRTRTVNEISFELLERQLNGVLVKSNFLSDIFVKILISV